jgi:thioredoxin
MKQLALIIVGFALMTNIGCSQNKSKSEGTSDSNASPVVHLTKAEFLKKVVDYEKNPNTWVYLGDKPCIVDFYADWCRPCKIAGPILEDLAKEYKGKIYVYKINTDLENELSSAFGIRSIPAFLYCPKTGQPQMSAGIGSSPEETKAMFKKMIDEFLLAK